MINYNLYQCTVCILKNNFRDLKKKKRNIVQFSGETRDEYKIKAQLTCFNPPLFNN